MAWEQQSLDRWPLRQQAPAPSSSELSPEEMQTVQLFLDNTPSVVNIANIGEGI